MKLRIGQGYDVHALGEKRQLILGGVNVPHSHGLIGHSDADVLVHAVMDGLLGALAQGDIGQWFPDNDPSFKGADSMMLLAYILQSPTFSNWQLVNLDCTIIAQKPKLATHLDQMKSNLAAAFNAETDQISVKATTTEKLGFCGREEGIAAMAVVLLSS